MTNVEGMTKPELRNGLSVGWIFVCQQLRLMLIDVVALWAFVIGHSFVIGYFVICHSRFSSQRPCRFNCPQHDGRIRQSAAAKMIRRGCQHVWTPSFADSVEVLDD